jgi:catenin alpha
LTLFCFNFLFCYKFSIIAISDDEDDDQSEDESNETDSLLKSKRKSVQIENISKEQRVEIKGNLDLFRQEKREFQREVLKWDDNGNDIIVLAKRMCVIMMNMTDFTRGRGPLKQVSDIIVSAKKISECGVQMEKLVLNLAQQVSKNEYIYLF